MVTIYFDWNSRNEDKQYNIGDIINQQPKSILQNLKPKIIEKVQEKAKLSLLIFLNQCIR